MPGFDAEPWEIAAAAGLCRDVGEGLRAGLGRLSLDVETLLDGWRGRAGTNFARGWQDWRAGASDVLAALESMAGLLDASGRGYAAAEADTVSVLR